MTPEAVLLAQWRGMKTIQEMYADLVAAGVDVGRDGGYDIVHGQTDQRWKRRFRGALQTAKRKGRARRTVRDDGVAVWILFGTPEQPQKVLALFTDGTGRDVELRLQPAAELLASLPGQVDFIGADGPYAINVGQGEAVDTGARTYGRDESCVVPGYVDVDPKVFRDFTSEWIAAAAVALRPGGVLAAITGPQQAAWTQVAAEDAGLTYVNSVVVEHPFPLYTKRRFAHGHWVITIVCRGKLDSPRRVFNPPADQVARSGRRYPVDTWRSDTVGRADAKPGALRYRNSLPLRMVDRLVGAFTRRPQPGTDPDLVVDPFLGGGTTAVVAVRRGLRFVGGDVNQWSLAFTSRRISHELPTATSPTDADGPAQLALI